MRKHHRIEYYNRFTMSSDNQFVSYPIKLINDHIIIDNGQKLIFDTGSPLSFHKSGTICIGESIDVPTSLLGISDTYLSEKVGCVVNGLIGMDIISKFPTHISVKDGLLFFNDDARYYDRFVRCHNNTGLLCVNLKINGRMAKMIVDSGAKVSYINNDFVAGIMTEGCAYDYSPYIGDFQTSLYKCRTELLVRSVIYEQLYGTPPPLLANLLRQYGVDGIIGVELFKRFRIQINGGDLYFPPQGI